MENAILKCFSRPQQKRKNFLCFKCADASADASLATEGTFRTAETVTRKGSAAFAEARTGSEIQITSI